MAMTLLGVPKKDRESNETVYYLSQEYSPTKNKDALGNIVPNQEWQHPVPETLSYCRLGVVTGTDRTDGILKSLLTLGAGQMGGHIRIILETAEWIEERVETLDDRRRREKQEEDERYAHHIAEQQEERRRAVITLAEIQKGIELLAEGKRLVQLEQWLRQDLEAWFSGRILSVDSGVAGRWASLVTLGAQTGRPLPTVDSLIAATALAHGLTVVTGNVRDFDVAGVATLKPAESL